MSLYDNFTNDQIQVLASSPNHVGLYRLVGFHYGMPFSVKGCTAFMKDLTLEKVAECEEMLDEAYPHVRWAMNQCFNLWIKDCGDFDLNSILARPNDLQQVCRDFLDERIRFYPDSFTNEDSYTRGLVLEDLVLGKIDKYFPEKFRYQINEGEEIPDYKRHPYFNDYSLYRYGRIYDCVKKRWLIISEKKGRNYRDGRADYLYVSLRLPLQGQKRRLVEIQVLMAETFIGPRPSAGYVVDHINGDPHDNHIWNLRYLTHSDNAKNSKRS